MNVTTELSGAVTRGEIRAVFQPQIDIASRRIVAVEALARWTHPTLGAVSPAEFIPLAEQLGLIGEIGDFMLDESCRCSSQWIAAGLIVEVAVNVSPAQLATVDFLDRIQSNLDRHNLSADSLTIEITESLPVAEVPTVLVRLAELRDLGVGVSVDDFGTGHASTERLATLPVSELKLDQSLVQDLNPPPLFLTEAIALARAGGVRVVAEGVETEEQFERAREIGCDRAQGYLFGRPASEADITRELSAV
jgi:EAL domain-containing protein (putative c-di-GMP-specific phosphodiesterase class I)